MCARCKRHLGMAQFEMQGICIKCQDVMGKVTKIEEDSKTNEKRLI